MHLIIHEKGIVFSVTYGKIHELLTWKIWASLISSLMMTLWHSLYYLGNLCKNFLTRNGFEDFVNIVDIWLLKCFMKLLRSELCVSNTLTYELLMWFFPCAMTLVTTSSMWWPRLCDNPVCVTTLSMWQPRQCDNLVVWPWVRFLVLKWY